MIDIAKTKELLERKDNLTKKELEFLLSTLSEFVSEREKSSGNKKMTPKKYSRPLKEIYKEDFEDFKSYVLSRGPSIIELFKSIYGENLDEYHEKKLSGSQNTSRCRIFREFNAGARLEEKDLQTIFGDEYEEFKAYILTRSEYAVSLFKKRYGENLDSFNDASLTDKEKKLIRYYKSEYLKSNRKLIKQPTIKNYSKPLREVYGEDFEDFKSYVLSRSPSIIELFKSIYGENLDEYHERKLNRSQSTSKSRIFREFNAGARPEEKDLKSIFGDEYENFKAYILTKPSHIVSLFKKRYGENLDSFNDMPLTSRERSLISYYKSEYMKSSHKLVEEPILKNYSKPLREVYGEDFEDFKTYVLSRQFSTTLFYKQRYGEELDTLNDMLLTETQKALIRRVNKEFASGARGEKRDLKSVYGNEYESVKTFILSRSLETINAAKKQYGENLDRFNNAPLTKNERRRLDDTFRSYENSGFIKRNVLKKQLGKKYDRFKAYILSDRQDPSITMLFKMEYGEELDTCNNVLTDEQRQIVNDVVDRFYGRKKEEGIHLREESLPEKYGEEFETFKAFILSKSPEAIKLFKIIYGENLDEFNHLPLTKEQAQLLYNIRWQYNKRKKAPEKKTSSSDERKKTTKTIESAKLPVEYSKSLIEIFKEDYNEFKNYLFSKSIFVIRIFKKVYGEKLDVYNEVGLTKSELSTICNVISKYEKDKDKEKKSRFDNNNFLKIYLKIFNNDFKSMFTEPETALYLLRAVFKNERNGVIEKYEKGIEEKENIRLIVNMIRRKIIQIRSKRGIFIINIHFLYKLEKLGVKNHELTKILKNIPSEILRELYLAYGRDLNENNIDNLSEEDKNRLENIIVPYVLDEITSYYESQNIKIDLKENGIERYKANVEASNAETSLGAATQPKAVSRDNRSYITKLYLSTPKFNEKPDKTPRDVTVKTASTDKFFDEFKSNYGKSFDDYFENSIAHKYLLTNAFNMYVINISLGYSKDVSADLEMLVVELKSVTSKIKEFKIDPNLSLNELVRNFGFTNNSHNTEIMKKISRNMQELLVNAYGNSFKEVNLDMLSDEEKKLLLNVVVPYYFVKLKEHYAKVGNKSSKRKDTFDFEKINTYADTYFPKDSSKTYY